MHDAPAVAFISSSSSNHRSVAWKLSSSNLSLPWNCKIKLISSQRIMALSSFFGRRNDVWDMVSHDPMEVMVRTLFDNEAPATSFARDAHAMASTGVDWKETATEHVFKVDLPGLRKEDVQVQVEDGRTLSISGQRKREEVHKADTWHRVERSSGSFLRKFRLPENANLDGITAKVENGELTVVVPKVEKLKAEARRIEIGGGAQAAIDGPGEEQVIGAATPPQQ